MLALLSMSDCPAIRLLTDSRNPLVKEDIPEQLHSPPHSIALIDRYEGSSFQSSFKNVDVVFHSGTTLDPHDESSSIDVINAAKSAGVSHFILCSVLQPVRSKLYTHKAKLQ